MPAPIILGIDEVGRGPWAGPLVVGAVILGEKFSAEQLSSQPPLLQEFWHDLTDSKKLTEKKRLALEPLILSSAAATGLGWVSAAELDQHGLSASLKLATRRAVKQVLAQKIPFSEIIIDGAVNFLQDTPLADRVTLLKKADLLIKEVSAASIIAKVARDNYMKELALQHPAYGFEKHVGYGTATHRSALLEYGPCPEHRRSFKPIQKLYHGISNIEDMPKSHKVAGNEPTSILLSITPTSTARGRQAERLVAEYLEMQGHKILAQNFRTKAYEIDLISTKNHQIFFTEVKYRQNSQHGTSLDQITAKKQQQMQFAAQAFLAQYPSLNHEPMLAVAAVSSNPPKLQTWFTLEQGI